MALIRGEKRTGFIAIDSNDADRTTPSAYEQEQTSRTWKGSRPSPWGAIVLPGPLRRGGIGVVEEILRRVASFRDAATLARSDGPRP